MSTVDGPGLRAVVFMQGCEFRCIYCHNPDTWQTKTGDAMSVADLTARLRRYTPYYGNGGGVTFSGGEPLLQAAFVHAAMVACHEAGLHTALDTNGHFLHPEARAVIAESDLVILDIKHTNAEKHHALTSRPLEPTLRFLDHLTEHEKPMWVRQVTVPGWNDTADDMEALAELLEGRANLERVELLPLHHLGREKWSLQKLDYAVSDTKPPGDEQMRALNSVLSERGLPITFRN